MRRSIAAVDRRPRVRWEVDSVTIVPPAEMMLVRESAGGLHGRMAATRTGVTRGRNLCRSLVVGR
jgi:hypothetical protein